MNARNAFLFTTNKTSFIIAIAIIHDTFSASMRTTEMVRNGRGNGKAEP